MKRLHDESGSFTIETAILFPILIAILLFGCVSILFCVQYCQIEQCFYNAAEIMTDYAYLYHEKTISVITAEWRKQVEDGADVILTELLSNVPEELQELFDIKGYLMAYSADLLDQAESQIYIPIAQSIFQYQLQKAGLEDVVSAINFSKSTFFINDTEICLDATCEVDFSIPFLSQKTVQVHYAIAVNGWVNGVGGVKEPEENIWELDNFSRGKRIRHMYGGNLPDTFPVIAKFENGLATMIKSVDVRKESYQTEGALSSNIIAMLHTLQAYQGQSVPYGKEKITILPSQIRKKELLLVIPNITLNELVQQELYQAKTWANQHNIIFTIEKL